MQGERLTLNSRGWPQLRGVWGTGLGTRQVIVRIAAFWLLRRRLGRVGTGWVSWWALWFLAGEGARAGSVFGSARSRSGRGSILDGW